MVKLTIGRHWNYRVVKRTVQSVLGMPAPEDEYGIHDCYYDSRGLVHSFSVDPINVVAESLDELKSELERMTHALNSPVLDYDKLPEPGALSEEDDSDDLPDLESEDQDEIVRKS